MIDWHRGFKGGAAEQTQDVAVDRKDVTDMSQAPRSSGRCMHQSGHKGDGRLGLEFTFQEVVADSGGHCIAVSNIQDSL